MQALARAAGTSGVRGRQSGRQRIRQGHDRCISGCYGYCRQRLDQPVLELQPFEILLHADALVRAVRAYVVDVVEGAFDAVGGDPALRRYRPSVAPVLITGTTIDARVHLLRDRLDELHDVAAAAATAGSAAPRRRRRPRLRGSASTSIELLLDRGRRLAGQDAAVDVRAWPAAAARWSRGRRRAASPRRSCASSRCSTASGADSRATACGIGRLLRHGAHVGGHLRDRLSKRRHPLEVRARDLVQLHGKVEPLERRERGRQVIDGVVVHRQRAVAAGVLSPRAWKSW